MAFSTRTFIQYILQHASNLTRLLQVYYAVSVRLDIFALTIRSILAYIPELDSTLCELFSYEEEIGQGMQVLKVNNKNEKINVFFTQLIFKPWTKKHWNNFFYKTAKSSSIGGNN